MFRTKKTQINVLMFHSIGNENSSWYRRGLSVALNHFEQFCKYLSSNGYSTGFLDDWYISHNKKEIKEEKKLYLTFDDGYLDTWVFAYPVLKKYGLRGTVFINPEFIHPDNILRANLEDVWDEKIHLDDLTTLGFLSWPEVQKMDSEGIVQAQSHSMSHNFYFKSDKIIDFYFGQPEYDWLAWIIEPNRKPFYMSENQSNIPPYGYPVFEFYRALGLRQYVPDQNFIRFITSLAIENKENFTNDSLTKTLLLEKAREYIHVNGSAGSFENDEELELRFRYELFESKKLIEEKTGHKVEFLCWPGGGYTEQSLSLSVEAGYKASTMGSWEKDIKLDYSMPYKRIIRKGVGSFIISKKGRFLIKCPDYLIYHFKAVNGNLFMRLLLKIHKEFIKFFVLGLRK